LFVKETIQARERVRRLMDNRLKGELGT